MKPYTESELATQGYDDAEQEAYYSSLTGKEATKGHDFRKPRLAELKGLVNDGHWRKWLNER